MTLSKETFTQKQYHVVQSFLTQEMTSLLSAQIDIYLKARHHLANCKETDFAWGGGGAPKSWNCYGEAICEGVLSMMQPRVEEVVGCKLYSTYSLMRRYYNQGSLIKHTDRHACQYSVTIPIDTDSDSSWPIWFNVDGTTFPIHLNVGDALVYTGGTIMHWREPYSGNKHTQMFLHYVDADGPFRNHKYDQRLMLGLPACERTPEKL